MSMIYIYVYIYICALCYDIKSLDLFCSASSIGAFWRIARLGLGPLSQLSAGPPGLDDKGSRPEPTGYYRLL